MAPQAKKRFGQHFLTDQTVIDRIAAAVADRHQTQVVEIGPGQGALTRALLERGLSVIAVEIDRDMATHLRREFAGAPLTIIEEDALRVDLASLPLAPPYVVCGNLPYNISTPLLFQFMDAREDLDSVTVMLQADVVVRILAPPGGRDYGRLSVMLQTYFRGRHLLTIGPHAFDPPPKVDSAVVQLFPKADPPTLREAALFSDVVKMAFQSRRKTVRNALKSLATKEELETWGLDTNARPETLSPEQYVALANQLYAAKCDDTKA